MERSSIRGEKKKRLVLDVGIGLYPFFPRFFFFAFFMAVVDDGGNRKHADR